MDFAQAQITLDDRGCPYSPEFGDIYASRDGAFEQSRFVFLKGNRLPDRWQGREKFTILENGFGLGTNFLSTLKAWREDPNRSEKLFYLAIEGYPADAEALVKFADDQLREQARELADKWPELTPGVHRLSFEQGRVVLDLYFMPSAQAAKKLAGTFDALYLDGFSPKKNPRMWEARLLKALCAKANTGATLSTWCVAGAVRQALTESGFYIEKAAGFGHKSQMTIGRFEPRFRHRRNGTQELSLKRPKSVIVVGAGLAGAAVAQELSERGLKVTVIDSGPIAAAGASALRWGVFHAQPSGDDNFLFRLSRSGLELLLKRRSSFPDLIRSQGLFQMARDESEYGKWESWFKNQSPFAFPESFLHLLSVEEAVQRVGIAVRRGGLWHEKAGIAAVSQWVRRRLECCAAELVLNTKIKRISKEKGLWTAYTDGGIPAARAEAVVVCCAGQSGEIAGIELPLTQWRGRLSLLCGNALQGLNGAATGPGYAIKSPDGWSGVGATYESSEKRLSDREAHIKNLEHLRELFPNSAHSVAAGFYSGFRCVAPDRMPVIGRVRAMGNIGENEHFYLSCAMGSRGTVFCEIGSKIISAQMFGEPVPLEADLIRAVSPERFAS